jgi:uncharacterized protein (DUF486 family)
MTIAWYGHLKYRRAPLITVIVVSWLIAFLEYCCRFKQTDVVQTGDDSGSVSHLIFHRRNVKDVKVDWQHGTDSLC